MNQHMMKYVLVFACLSIFDRMTKMMALVWCVAEKGITPFLSCETVINRGIALGIGHGGSLWGFYVSLFAAVAVTLYCGMYAHELWRLNLSLWGIGAVVIGAISNITDRLLYGGVIDFIVVHYRGWAFPTFNVADMMICLGIVVLIWQQRKNSV